MRFDTGALTNSSAMWFVVWIASGFALAGDSTQVHGGDAPALPLVELGARLGEGHQYGRWQALKGADVYNTWREGRLRWSRLEYGSTVVAAYSVVVTTKPGVIRMDRDMPERGLKRGDTILTYGFVNEGFSTAWAKGRLHADFDISFTKYPDGGGCGGTHCAATYITLPVSVRWVQLRLKPAVYGWVLMGEASFMEVVK